MARRRRGYEQVRDMGLSLGLVIVFVFVTVAFLGGSLGIVRTEPLAREVRPVDYRPALGAAVQASDYEVLAPTGVPGDWVCQSARTAPAEPEGPASVLLQIGFLTPGKRYASVVQTDAEPGDVIESQRLGDDVEATVDVEGQRWEQRRRVDRDELALLRTDGARTVVVTGDAGLDELRVLAASLESADRVPAGEPGAPDAYEPIG